eukprot:scaffold5529_cov117-Cylindrotheca_fusiformis.AAC.29
MVAGSTHIVSSQQWQNPALSYVIIKPLALKKSKQSAILTDAAAQILGSGYYANVSLSRMPGLVATNAPFFLGGLCDRMKFLVFQLRTRFTRLYKSVWIYLQLEFKKNTAKCDSLGNRIFFSTYDDNSKHLGTKSHIIVCLPPEDRISKAWNAVQFIGRLKTLWPCTSIKTSNSQPELQNTRLEQTNMIGFGPESSGL